MREREKKRESEREREREKEREREREREGYIDIKRKSNDCLKEINIICKRTFLFVKGHFLL